MPIICMLDNASAVFPDGAYCDLYWSRTATGHEPRLEHYRIQERCPHCDCGRVSMGIDLMSLPHADRPIYGLPLCIACRGTGGTGQLINVSRWIGPVVLHEAHVGLCLRERERNMHDDSDFFMLVWNPEKGEAEELMFATTRGWSYPCLASRVDATSEVIAAWDSWSKAQQRRRDVMGRRSRRKADAELARKAGVSSRTAIERLRAAYPYQGDAFDRITKLLTTKLRSEFRKKLAGQVREWLADPAPRYAAPLSPRQVDYV